MEKNLNTVFSVLEAEKIDCLILIVTEKNPSNDIADFTGFTGSNGIAIISPDKKCVFLTDSRYTLQAQKQIDNNYFHVQMLTRENVKNIISDKFAGKTIRLDFDQFTLSNIELFIPANIKIKHFNLYRALNFQEKQQNANNIFIYDYAGSNFKERFSKVRSLLSEKEPQILITNPHSSSWLLGIRRKDNYDMSVKCTVLADMNGIAVFSNEKFKISNVNVLDFCDLHKKLLPGVVVDHKSIPYSYAKALQDKSISFIAKEDEIAKIRSVKTDSEIENFKKIHIIDGASIIKFLFWIEHYTSEITELSAANKLHALRRENDLFLYDSFKTISAFGQNSSMVHYTPTENSNAVLSKNNIYLIDSGGHYLGGTTDVTRTIPIGGNPLQKQKLDFTLVLKCNIAIALTIFPTKTKCSSLDGIARANLWKNFEDCPHSIGHGVSNALHVHEGPYSISSGCSELLTENIVLSNEPGIYREGEYGIRIENLMFTKKTGNNFLEFEQLTKVPIDGRMVCYELLTNQEREWLTLYNTDVYNKTACYLSQQEKLWLMALMG